MSQTTWSMRAMEAGDLDLIRALYATVWGYNRPRDYDQWRYFTAPDGMCPAMLAMDGGRAAGFYTAWPVKLLLGAEVVVGIQSMDTMTHPDYQGQGMFVNLASACYELAASRGMEVIYGFPNPLSYPGFVRRLNLDHSGDIAHWIRPIRPSSHPRVPGALGPLADIAMALWPKGTAGGVEIRLGRPQDADLGTLLDTWCAEPDLCRIERTPEWLDWRYAPEAGHGYEWVCAYEGDTVIAAGVWGMRDATWGKAADNRAHLVELLGGHHRGLQAVLATVIARAGERRAWLLETLSNVAPVVTALKRAGFMRHRMAPFIVRALTSRPLGANVHAHASWRIMGGDVDTL
jgi:GNAT superfamily N-acetyltransferase